LGMIRAQAPFLNSDCLQIERFCLGVAMLSGI
jgi:hypothetical protein